MTVYIVTRHAGAIEWIQRQLSTSETTVLRHVDDQAFHPGDRVCGVLPLSLAARICAAGAQAHVLSYDTPEAMRGQELSAEALDKLGAQLVRYDVRVLSSGSGHGTGPSDAAISRESSTRVSGRAPSSACTPTAHDVNALSRKGATP